jgi:hypothetical protein
MTATVTPSPTPTPFDYAFASALAAGWMPRQAFDACVLMLSSGMTAAEIERAFRDCSRRVQ